MDKQAKCMECGKKFSVPKWRVGKAKYCSYACSDKGRTSNKAYNKPRICEGCNKEFLPTQWYQKFCSRDCFYKSVKKTGIKVCKTCGKKFTQVRKAQKYCSRKCSNPYKEKILKKPKNVNLDNLWSKKVKSIAGDKCEYCGKTTGLNSHHIFSRSNRRVRWNVNNGVCVCVLHHVFGLFSAHKSPIEFIEWLKDTRGEKWYNDLRVEARVLDKLTEEEKTKIKEELGSNTNLMNLKK